MIRETEFVHKNIFFTETVVLFCQCGLYNYMYSFKAHQSRLVTRQ